MPWGIDKDINKVYNSFVMAKYDGMRKIERNKTLREYALAHPELSNEEIGAAFNISGPRVWVILNGKKKVRV